MKNLIKPLLLAVLFFYFSKYFSQSALKCAGTQQSNTIAPCANNQLLGMFKPISVDPTLTVNVVFWVFRPTTATTSAWGGSSLADMDNVFATINPTLQSLNLPFYNMGALPSSDTKIRFVRKAFNSIVDPLAYSNYIYAQSHYFDSNALNVYFVDMTTAPGGGNGLAAIGDKAAFIFSGNSTDNVSQYSYVILHELGHCLGLAHTYILDGYSYIKPKAGCCQNFGIYANDYVLESVADFGNLYGAYCWAPPSNTINPGSSNNVMGQNQYCRSYLSQDQIAIMQYYLLAEFPEVLTAQSYIDATETATYNYTVGVTLGSGATDTWTQDYYSRGDIIIPQGKTLIIKCGVFMKKNRLILVKKGGRLIIDGGHVTSLGKRTWQGIVVEGDNTKNQNLNYSAACNGCAISQGMVQILNNGTISNAETAVSLGINGTPFKGGGIIDCQDAKFIDNYRDVNFAPYTKFKSISRFVNTKFIENLKIGDGLWPDKHVILTKINGVGFYGCTFQNTISINSSPNRGTGIFSTDANYTINKSTQGPTLFYGLDKGIHVNNINPLSGPSVYFCKFINNYGYGAYFMNTNYLSFLSNTLIIPGGIPVWAGVYLNNCKYYTIRNNEFYENLTHTGSLNGLNEGISIFNSSFGFHQVYRNTFSNLFIGINAMGNNSGINNLTDGLKINCIDFNKTYPVWPSSVSPTTIPTYTPFPNKYDVALDLGFNNSPPSVMKRQGEVYQSNQDRFNLVRNIYGANCNGTQQNKWYIHSASTKTVDHGVNTQAVTNPSACSNNLVNVVTSTISLNYASDCEVNPASSGGSASGSFVKIDNLNNYITALRPVADDGDNKNEIQASVSSKLNLFMTDSLVQSGDSVVAILENNQGSMLDADVQAVFAYLFKEDYTTATTKINALSNTKPDWANLLNKLMAVEQDSEGIYSLKTNPTNRNFFIIHANTDGLDGQAVAQAILKAACDSNYIEPHNRPEEANTGSRNSEQVNSVNNSIQENSITAPLFKLYPNPVNSNLTIEFYSNSIRSAYLEIKDILGRLLLIMPIEANTKQSIFTEHFTNGLYFITLSENQKIISTYKLIKQN